MSKRILKQLAELPQMNLNELRSLWDKLYPIPCPGQYRKAYLVRRLAYRIQELEHGGLSDEDKATMRKIATAKVTRPKAGSMTLPPPGTQFSRVWQGEEHQVTVDGSRFIYREKPYRSLSAVARAITGTSWNGPKFFGLRR